MLAPCVYIMSNKSRTLYVGATTDLVARVRQHREKTYPSGFTARYHFDKLVYYEVLPTYAEAVKREKEIKAWRRQKKIALIQEKNPWWYDLTTSYLELLMGR